MHSEPKNASIALSLWLGRRGAIKPVWIRINTGYDSPNVMSELERRLKIEDFGGRKHSSSSSSSHDVTTQQLQCCLFSCLIMMLDLSISSFPPSIHTPLCSESVPVVRGQKKLFVCVCVCMRVSSTCLAVSVDEQDFSQTGPFMLCQSQEWIVSN